MSVHAQRPLPVTAYSVCNALGRDRDEVLAALREGRGGLGEPGIELAFPTCAGVVSHPFAPLPAALSPWSTRMARMTAALVGQLEPAMARARERWSPKRIGIILGTSTAGAETTEAAYRTFVRSGALPDGYDFRRQHTYGAILHVVSQTSGAAGPAWMVSTACTSSAKPLASASRLIRQGVLDAAIVGGFDTLCAMTLRGFHALGALSTGRCRPFSASRDGISIGEGGALLLLEREGDAVALLEGVGESSDAYHISAPHPQGEGATLAMARALAEAGLSAEQVDHINAHGTGTRLNDEVEARAIEALFGQAVPVVSTKGYTGHTLGAAGATEAVFAILSIEEGWVPGSLGAEPKDEAIALHVPAALTRGSIRRVLSNSFAFGGNNVSVLMGAP